MGRTTDDRRERTSSITAPGLLLGIGFGGLVDGVVLHQLLQWHHMLSSTGRYPATTVRGLEANTLADGLFHLTTIVLLLVGTVLLWRRVGGHGVVWSGRQLVGLGLAGWGLFDLVEGLVDHQILGVHHVRTGPDQFAFDMAFLALGALLLVVGLVMARGRGERGSPDSA